MTSWMVAIIGWILPPNWSLSGAHQLLKASHSKFMYSLQLSEPEPSATTNHMVLLPNPQFSSLSFNSSQPTYSPLNIANCIIIWMQRKSHYKPISIRRFSSKSFHTLRTHIWCTCYYKIKFAKLIILLLFFTTSFMLRSMYRYIICFIMNEIKWNLTE